MIFDTMADLVERWSPDLRPVLQAAMLIYYDAAPHEVTPAKWDDPDYWHQNFQLPSRVTALEDRASCIVLIDREPGQKGMGCLRHFIECMACDETTDTDNFGDTFEDKLTCRECTHDMAAGSHCLNQGDFFVHGHTGDEFTISGAIRRTLIATAQTQVLTIDNFDGLPPDAFNALTMAATRNAVVAMEELVHIQQQPEFQGWPGHEPDLTPSHHIWRSTERPTFKVGQGGVLELK